MDFRRIIKEDFNSRGYNNMGNFIKINPFDSTASNSLKDNKENLKPNLNYDKSSKEIHNHHSTDDVPLDISMLSINDEGDDKAYYLPESDDLKNNEVINVWVQNMKIRRFNNRIDVYHQIDNFKPILDDLSFDEVTGERYIIQAHDHRQELEMTKLPLGKNFLKNTNITSSQRMTMIDCLFSLADTLKADRCTVSLAMSYADRYVKAKGKKMPLAKYKFMVMCCWFLACKYDLIYYPSMEDICDTMEISDPKIILDFEIDILETIDCYLGITTPIDFLRPLSLLKQRRYISHNIAKLFVDVSLYSYDLAGHPSHMIAAACHCLSLALCFRANSVESMWVDLLKMYTGLDIRDLKPIISVLGHIIATTDIVKTFPALEETHSAVLEVISKKPMDILALSKE